MAALLSIVANPKQDAESVSKKMLGSFLAKYRAAHPGDTVVTLDLYEDGVPDLTEEYIKVMYGQAEASKAGKKTAEILKRSDTFIGKLKVADRIVVTVPMWNFSVPPAFKKFIDLVIFPGKTFAFKGPGQYEGLLKGKKVLCLGARGGIYAEEPYKAYDMEEPWLRNVFAFMGITDFSVVWAQGTNMLQGNDLQKMIDEAVRQAGEKAH